MYKSRCLSEKVEKLHKMLIEKSMSRGLRWEESEAVAPLSLALLAF